MKSNNKSKKYNPEKSKQINNHEDDIVGKKNNTRVYIGKKNKETECSNKRRRTVQTESVDDREYKKEILHTIGKK